MPPMKRSRTLSGAAGSATTKKSKSSPTEQSSLSDSEGQSPNDALKNTEKEPLDIPEFETICQPAWSKDEDSDAESEDGDDGGSEGHHKVPKNGENENSANQKDGESKDGKEGPHGPTCMCRKKATDFPDHVWAFTPAAIKLIIECQNGVRNRDQDLWGAHFFNDFSWYGIQEVVENVLYSFNKAWRSRKKSPFGLWSHVEALAYFLVSQQEWFLMDDSERVEKTIELIGTAVLTTFETMRDQRLLSKIRNAGLVGSLLLAFADSWEYCSSEDAGRWVTTMVAMLIQGGVKVQGYKDEKALAEAARNEMEDAALVELAKSAKSKKRDSFELGSERDWKCWDWSTEFANFSRDYGVSKDSSGKPKIGGKEYDISKMPKSQLKSHQFAEY